MTGNARHRREVVTHPRTRAPRALRQPSAARQAAGQDGGEQPGDAAVRALMRAQLRAGLGVCATLALTLGILPLVFALAPSVGRIRVLGLGLPWFTLGFAVYPAMLLLARAYVRRAERAERDFAAATSIVGPTGER